MQKVITWCLISPLLFICSSPLQAKTWATGKVQEVDRCASAWLIIRQVDQDAKFLFLDDNQLPPDGVAPFDLPVAELRRSPRNSTYGAIIQHYAISDQKVKEMGRLVNAIELNFWGYNEKEARELEAGLRAIFQEKIPLEESYSRCFHYLDNYPAKQ